MYSFHNTSIVNEFGRFPDKKGMTSAYISTPIIGNNYNTYMSLFAWLAKNFHVTNIPG